MRKTLRPKELAHYLQKHGFMLVRQTGSHAHFLHQDGRWTTVPVHNRELKKGTLHQILKDVSLSLEDLA